MKSKFYIVFVLCSILLLSSCSHVSGDIGNNNDIITGFKSDLIVTQNTDEINCTFIRSTENVGSIEIISPDILEGMQLDFVGDTYEIKYKGLTYGEDSPFLPETSFMQIIINVISDVTNKDSLKKIKNYDNNTIYTGKCGIGTYEVAVNDNTGYIINIKANNNINIDFINHTNI